MFISKARFKEELYEANTAGIKAGYRAAELDLKWKEEVLKGEREALEKDKAEWKERKAQYILNEVTRMFGGGR